MLSNALRLSWAQGWFYPTPNECKHSRFGFSYGQKKKIRVAFPGSELSRFFRARTMTGRTEPAIRGVLFLALCIGAAFCEDRPSEVVVLDESNFARYRTKFFLERKNPEASFSPAPRQKYFDMLSHSHSSSCINMVWSKTINKTQIPNEKALCPHQKFASVLIQVTKMATHTFSPLSWQANKGRRLVYRFLCSGKNGISSIHDFWTSPACLTSMGRSCARRRDPLTGRAKAHYSAFPEDVSLHLICSGADIVSE